MFSVLFSTVAGAMWVQPSGGPGRGVNHASARYTEQLSQVWVRSKSCFPTTVKQHKLEEEEDDENEHPRKPAPVTSFS